jgi:hypothetical protein
LKFDQNNKAYIGNKIINSINVKVLPAVTNCFLFLKVIDLPMEGEVTTEIRVIDSANKIMSSSLYVHRNYRQRDEYPGVDQGFELTLLHEKTGIIIIECYINEIKTNWYPITVRLNKF